MQLKHHEKKLGPDPENVPSHQARSVGRLKQQGRKEMPATIFLDVIAIITSPRQIAPTAFPKPDKPNTNPYIQTRIL
jgi:hypothetical protein